MGSEQVVLRTLAGLVLGVITGSLFSGNKNGLKNRKQRRGENDDYISERKPTLNELFDLLNKKVEGRKMEVKQVIS